MTDANFLVFFIILSFSNAVETITGFGSTIIALTLGAHIYPIDFLVPVLVPVNIVLSAYIVVRHHRAVVHSVLWRNILPAAGLGLLIGAALFNIIKSETLAFAYGVFVLFFSIFELSRAVRSYPHKEFSWLQAIFWLLSGGIIQGIYASGGPLIVFYASRKLHDKGNFRSTLSALWLILNIVLLISHILTGKTTPITIRSSASLLPAMVLGIIIGERLHSLIPARAFRIFIFIVLIVAGASLILRLY